MSVSRSLGIFVLVLFGAIGSYSQSVASTVDVSPLGGVVTVTAPTAFVQPGQMVTVSISASDTTGQNITGFEAQIQYDSSVIVPVGGNAGCSITGTLFASSGGSLFCNNNTPAPNVITVFMFGVSPVTGTGPILRLNFQAVGPASAVSPINFNDFFFNEGDPVDATVNGSVIILSPTAASTGISGRVLSSSGAPISRARIVLSGRDGVERVALSNPFGYYRFRDVPVGETYTISATSKSYRFESRTLSVVDEVQGFDLIGLD